MSDTKYLEMLEIPVQTCDVVIKTKRRKKTDIKNKVIDMVNNDTQEVLEEKATENNDINNTEKRKSPKLSAFFVPKSKRTAKTKKPKTKKVEEVTSRSVKIKSSRFDIVSVQVVAIFVLIIGIILTNIFWENSGINTFLKSVFKEQDYVNTATYSNFLAYSPSKNNDVILDDGVMTIQSGSVYAPCDGTIENVSLSSDGLYTITVRHSNSFISVFSNLNYSYLEEGENVYVNIPLGYSSTDCYASLYSNDTLLTNYSINGDYIVWQN